MNVALIIFNRPDFAARVLAEIAKARPPRLFLIADGPRPDHPEDAAKCAAARAAAECQIDWKCEVIKSYSDANLGCGQRPASGISWVFEQVEEAIILEDDCVPHPSFFRYCDELLERYRDDERVMQIAGNNAHFGARRGSDSYFFSRHNICAGGWASWRRAWKHFDYGMKLWPVLRQTGWLRSTVGNERAAEYWKKKFQEGYEGGSSVNYWDYQWTFACWAQHGLTVIPSVQIALKYRLSARTALIRNQRQTDGLICRCLK